MDQKKDDDKEKKIYQKPVVTRVELVAEEAVLSACKQGSLGGHCAVTYSCNLAAGS